MKIPMDQARLALRDLHPRLDRQGLEQDFNSLDAQREACEAYVKSQAHEGWTADPRPLRRRRLFRRVHGAAGAADAARRHRGRRIDIVVVYKVDRLTRSLADFAKLVELFDEHGVSFVSVTQSFNTTTSMGRLTLNVLLSFAQFEREVTGERIRDKIAASKKKGMWMGGVVPLGYRVEDRALHIVEAHAAIVRSLFRRYLEAGQRCRAQAALDAESFAYRIRIDGAGRSTGGGRSAGGISTRSCRTRSMSAGSPTRAKHEGQHKPIVPQDFSTRSSNVLAIVRESL